MGSINYLQAIRPDTAYLKNIIENSLLSDWAITIEYLSENCDATTWQVWDHTFFAIRTAESVLAALMDCYTKCPRSTIRINAEKFRPHSRVLYTVYNPSYLPAKTDFRPQTSTSNLSRERGQTDTQIRLRGYDY